MELIMSIAAGLIGLFYMVLAIKKPNEYFIERNISLRTCKLKQETSYFKWERVTLFIGGVYCVLISIMFYLKSAHLNKWLVGFVVYTLLRAIIMQVIIIPRSIERK